jgi:protein-tyrosine phosphatase
MDFMYNQIIPDYNKITDRIYLGNIAGANNNNFLTETNIGYIVNLSNQWYPKKSNIKYLDIPIPDSPNTNIKFYFPEIINFFNTALKTDKNIYIHCRAGVSRSTTGLLAFLMSKGLNMKDAVNYVYSKRTIIKPNDGFWIQLMMYERELYGNNSVDYAEKYYH